MNEENGGSPSDSNLERINSASSSTVDSSVRKRWYYR